MLNKQDEMKSDSETDVLQQEANKNESQDDVIGQVIA